MNCLRIRPILIPIGMTMFVLLFGGATTQRANNLVKLFLDVRNGGFETPDANAPYLRVNPGLTIGAWRVGGDGVDLVGDYWQAADGKQSLHLGHHGEIWQSVATHAGGTYQLRFAVAGNMDGQQPIKHLQIWFDEVLVDTLAFDTSGHGRTEMGWRHFAYRVTAKAEAARLRFVAQGDEAWGPAIDAISITPADGE